MSLPRLPVLVACWATAALCCSDVPEARAAGHNRCGRFAGARLLRSPSIVVISRPVGEGDGGLGFERMRVFACLPSEGRLRLVGIANDPGAGGYADASITAHEGKQSIEALKLNTFGQLLLETGDGAEPPLAAVIAEQPNGRRRRLDSGPLAQIEPQSLSLIGHTAGWLDASGRHTATI